MYLSVLLRDLNIGTDLDIESEIVVLICSRPLSISVIDRFRSEGIVSRKSLSIPLEKSSQLALRKSWRYVPVAACTRGTPLPLKSNVNDRTR